MKHGVKLQRKHKVFLSGLGLNPKQFLLERQNENEYRFINLKSKRVEIFRRG